jgi:L-serine dehydratase
MISVFDLFKIGIGPSSSHTVGPMKAASAFIAGVDTARVARIRVELLGSLAWTGKGHDTDKAVLLGLSGEAPDTVDPDRARQIVAEMRDHRRLTLPGGRSIRFDPADISFDTVSPTPQHPNTLDFTAFDDAGAVMLGERWCSVGGGFVTRVGEALSTAPSAVPFPYRSAEELLALGRSTRLSIADLTLANERALRPAEEIDRYLARIEATMHGCIDRGLAAEGELPGGLKVRRRARALLARLQTAERDNVRHAHEIMDRISMFAIAVNEENAAGGRVVTAPTNGAAGVVPAVLRYYRDFCAGADAAGTRAFLLTATAIGALCKLNASISGAEVGCQGEVGVACAMAAGGLAAALGGSNEQIENAAEIGMEHHLGMTCDPVAGLVQIPCIERNAFGAVKAINAASLALHGDGTHRVSFDQVIATMYQTGADMHAKYKETSLGGLAVNFTEC